MIRIEFVGKYEGGRQHSGKMIRNASGPRMKINSWRRIFCEPRARTGPRQRRGRAQGGSQGGCQIEEDINLINVHCCNIRYVLQRESIQLHPLNMLLGRQLGKLELSLHSLRHHLNKRPEYEKKVMRKFPKISQSRRRPLLWPSPG